MLSEFDNALLYHIFTI